MSELLSKTESPPSPLREPTSVGTSVTPETITAMEQERLKELELLKNSIGRKLYFAIEEKIKREKTELETLLGLEQKRAAHRGEYSLVLDTKYFEQRFLN